MTIRDDDDDFTPRDSSAEKREALNAAFGIIRNVPIDEHIAVEKVAMRVLEAIASARRIRHLATDKCANNEYVDFDPTSIAATAMWMHVMGFAPDESEDVDPDAVGGQAMLGFAAALVLLEQQSSIELCASSLAEGDADNSHAVEGAMSLMAQAIAERAKA